MIMDAIPTNPDMDFYHLLISSPYVYLGLLFFQILIMFRSNISEFMKIWASHIRTKLKRKDSKEYLGDITMSVPSLTQSSFIYPMVKGKTNRVISVIDLAKTDSQADQVQVDMSSEVRPRFTIFYLKHYNDISKLMVVLGQLPVELLSTTVILKSEIKEIIIFYVSYYGHKIALSPPNNLVAEELLHG